MVKISNYILKKKHQNKVVLFDTRTSFSVAIDESLWSDLENNIELQSALRSFSCLEEKNEAKEVIDSFRESDGRMLELTIFVHGNCNFRCSYCYEKFENIAFLLENESDLIRFVDKNLSEYSFETLYVNWFGGEPLLAIDSILSLSTQLKKLASDHNVVFRSGISTNGYLLSPDILFQLLEHHVYTFQVTIDGMRDTHDQSRRHVSGQSTYFRILENLSLMCGLDNDFKLIIRFNVSLSNLDSVEEFLNTDGRMFKSDSRVFFFFKSVGGWSQRKLPNKLEGVHTDASFYLCKEAQKLGCQIENIYSVLQPSAICSARKPHAYAIDCYGNIIKCTTISIYEDINRISQLKNCDINHDSLDYWLDSYRYSTRCTNCPIFPICRGGVCPIEVADRDDTYCENKRKSVEKYLELFIAADLIDVEIIDD